jgi:hypothetical protein
MQEALTKGADTVVVRMVVGADITAGNGVVRRLLQFSAGKSTGGITIEQQRQHLSRMC